MDKRKIIVPIDFSETARNALIYAYGIGNEMLAMLQVLHVYRPIVSEIPEGHLIVNDPFSRRRKKFNELIDNVNQAWSSKSSDSIPIDSFFKVGFAVDEIKQLSQESRANTILIMGSNGDSGPIKKLFGSVTTNLATTCERPLLIIPAKAVYRGINTVVYAAEKYETDIRIIPELIARFDFCDYNISIIHVYKEDKPYPNKKLIYELNKIFPQHNFVFQNIYSDDIAQSVHDHSVDVEADLICVSHQNRGLIKNLFHRSITKKLTIFSQIPLLIINQK